MCSCYKKKKHKQLDEIRHTTPHCRPKNPGKKTKQLRERNSPNLADFQFLGNNNSLSLATLQHKAHIKEASGTMEEKMRETHKRQKGKRQKAKTNWRTQVCSPRFQRPIKLVASFIAFLCIASLRHPPMLYILFGNANKELYKLATQQGNS